MDVVEVNLNWVCSKMESAEQSLSAEAPGLSDACRDPELFPRVGDQFQVQIPTESSYHHFTKTPCYAFSTPQEFSIGLPISLMWIREDSNKIIHEPHEVPDSFISMSNRNEPVKSDRARKMEVFPDSNLKAKVEPMNVTVDKGIQLRNSERLVEIIQKCEGKGYYMVPGCLHDAWSEFEEASFILGLYIFGKNLVQVKKFVESKTMGAVLSHYYGDFYRSDKYIRWSDCRKMRSKRCVYGQRIFTGARQQELLSRLLPHLSEECQNTLAEVAEAFGEGKILLEEYVFKLKAMVGLSVLVEAVGIGKGKQDLTSFTSETQRSVQVAPTRPEIPVGKACSSLTPLEIIGFLTGGYRLSKTKSNDLFWEAVWPRLLARGWHSEQPNDNVCKHSLVFLIPGIKKFSRGKLVKGDHYFDSVRDVLSKVAVNPELLEFDTGGECKEDSELTKEIDLDQGDFPHKQRHCYLKPPNPSCNTDIIKFTIVDTSLADRRTKNVRELKSLPVDVMNFSTCRSDSDESENDSSDASMDGSECADDLSNAANITNILESKGSSLSKGVSCGKENYNDAAAKHCHKNGMSFSRVPIKSHQKANKSPDLQKTKTVKNHAKQRKRPAYEIPVAKRQQRETACDSVETSFSENDVSVIPTKRQNEVGCASDNSDFRNDILTRSLHGLQPRACRAPLFLDSSWENLSSTSSSSRDSHNFSDEYTPGSNFSGAQHPNERTQSRTLIDLNIPAPEDADTEPFTMEMTEGHNDQSRMQPEDRNIPKNFISALDSSSVQPPDMNSLRRSTRNRPPTAKALEALACGYLSITSRRKNEEDFPFPKSGSSRRDLSRLQTSGNCSSSSFDDSKGDETGNGANKSNETLNELQESSVTHVEKETPFLDLKLG